VPKGYLTIAIVLTLFITFMSFVPLQDFSTKGIHTDKILHGLAYGLLTLSWLLASSHLSKRPRYFSVVGFSVASYGMIIELLQGALTRFRYAEGLDILANSVGVLLAILFFKQVFNSRL